MILQPAHLKYRVIKIVCAPDDYSTETSAQRLFDQPVLLQTETDK
jgi:hypothetical protein